MFVIIVRLQDEELLHFMVNQHLMVLFWQQWPSLCSAAGSCRLSAANLLMMIQTKLSSAHKTCWFSVQFLSNHIAQLCNDNNGIHSILLCSLAHPSLSFHFPCFKKHNICIPAAFHSAPLHIKMYTCCYFLSISRAMKTHRVQFLFLVPIFGSFWFAVSLHTVTVTLVRLQHQWCGTVWNLIPVVSAAWFGTWPPDWPLTCSLLTCRWNNAACSRTWINIRFSGSKQGWSNDVL